MTPLLTQRLRSDRAFERLYHRHVNHVYRYVLAVLQDPTDAEDVTQTTFLNAYRAFGRGERPRSAHNWLIAIAHNVCRQRFRQASRRPTEVTLDESHGGVLDHDGEAPSPADIRRALGYLPFNQRAALVMRELEGRSYSDIAEILVLSVPAVETLIFRARRALREQLEDGLTCGEAERAISRQLDGALPRADKGTLRAHLRECPECATFARRQRAHRAALKGLGALPLPLSLQSLFGGGTAAGAGSAAAASVSGLGAKAAAVAAAGLVATGVAYEGARQAVPSTSDPKTARRPAASRPSPNAVERRALHVKVVLPSGVKLDALDGARPAVPKEQVSHVARPAHPREKRPSGVGREVAPGGHAGVAGMTPSDGDRRALEPTAGNRPSGLSRADKPKPGRTAHTNPKASPKPTPGGQPGAVKTSKPKPRSTPGVPRPARAAARATPPKRAASPARPKLGKSPAQSGHEEPPPTVSKPETHAPKDPPAAVSKPEKHAPKDPPAGVSADRPPGKRPGR